jgi:hypothetical protein
MLEQKIKERRQTFEEFAESLETFAREHGEKGTLGLRHLHRLAAGRRTDGRPLGPVQPATARLLEHMLGHTVEELLAPPASLSIDPSEAELRQRLYASSQVDAEMIDTLRGQLGGLRRLDRQLGAPAVHDEVCMKVRQVTELLTYCTAPGTREQIAALLSELGCLAGWQALDLGQSADAWHLYSDAVAAAKISEAPSFIALAIAGQAFALADVGRTIDAAEVLAHAKKDAGHRCPRLLQSWIAAAHGEILAANGERRTSLHSFDKANSLLPSDTNASTPYVALDAVHLSRWRGHALAQCGDTGAMDVLNTALGRLDTTFVRAETSLRVDMTIALAASGDHLAFAEHADCASQLAARIGSVRQQRRISSLRQSIRCGTR